jgi:hypothetical protein
MGDADFPAFGSSWSTESAGSVARDRRSLTGMPGASRLNRQLIRKKDTSSPMETWKQRSSIVFVSNHSGFHEIVILIIFIND